MPVLSVSGAEALLKENGLKANKARIAILQLLSAFSGPLPQGELLNLLDYDRITVYRIIRLFESKKMVTRIKTSKQKNSFQLTEKI
ncbi:MAG TPA: transcriptional repressor [Mucilaginibacter sp.]